MLKHLGVRLLLISVVAGLAGCAMPPQGQTTSQTSMTLMEDAEVREGSVAPAYNPPAGTPFHCTYIGFSAPLFSVPGDIGENGLGYAMSPVSTMGNRRGDWLLVVTRTGVIGWVYQPQEVSIAEAPGHPIRYCHVHQDAEGRIVFNWSPEYSGEF
jgi:hypothetical protein